MEEAIKTFMSFLKADKENRFQIFARLFSIKNPRTTVDPTVLLLLKKVNHKVNDLSIFPKSMHFKGVHVNL